MVGDQRQGWAVLAAMAVLFIAGAAVSYWAEASGTTALNALGLTGGNMEGKEVRFGILGSALFAVVTTAASCGAVNGGALDRFVGENVGQGAAHQHAHHKSVVEDAQRRGSWSGRLRRPRRRPSRGCAQTGGTQPGANPGP